MKLVTWNVNSIRIRLDIIEDWIRQHRPQVLCFQETKVEDDKFPASFFDRLDYDVEFHGQKSYHGVAIASNVGMRKLSTGLPGFVNDQARVITALVNGVCVVSIYVPNGGDAEKLAYKLRFYACLKKYLQELVAQHAVVAIGGDYNVAPTNEDVYDIEDYGHDGICVKPVERAAYATLLANGDFVDAHVHLGGAAHSHTWWDYRQGSVDKDRGLRIDHWLVAGTTPTALYVDKQPRTAVRPSDHAPVVLELQR